MSQSHEPERKSKSYRGCIPCKLGRRKCTEESPTCSHCEKMNLKCEYDTESLFRFHVFQYEGNKKKLTQSAQRGPPVNQPSSIPQRTNQHVTKPVKQRAKKPKQLPPPTKPVASQKCPPPATKEVAVEELDLETSALRAVNNATICQPVLDVNCPWQSFPVPDPFFDFFCESKPSVARPAAHPDPSENTEQNVSAVQNQYPIFLSPAPYPDPDITVSDMPYFRYFLSEMANMLPYVKIFPTTLHGIFSSSIHHPALRHSLLSVSALCCAKKYDQGKQYAFEHLSKSLTLLQRSLSSVEVDECVANAIFLLAYFNLLSGDKSSARKHLQGLSLVLHQIRQNHFNKNSGPQSAHAISPLTMLIWRMAIRVDFIIAITCAQRPIYPPVLADKPASNEDFHRQWIEQITDKTVSSDSIEWALAWFALDNTMHRACHIAADAHQLRNLGGGSQFDAERKILESVDGLVEQHRQWKERAIVKKAEELERKAGTAPNLGPTETKDFLPPGIELLSPWPTCPATPRDLNTLGPDQFLDYPRLYITNAFYHTLLNHYNAIELMISLIARPIWEKPDPHRLQCAVDICRTHTAVGVRPDSVTAGKIWGIYLAGVAFGGPDACPMESEWIYHGLLGLGSYCYSAPKMAKLLRAIWEMKGNYWDAAATLYKDACEAEGVEAT